MSTADAPGPAWPAPPSGWMPPRTAPAPDGSELDLAAIARAASDRFLAAEPEFLPRYGPPGVQWCVHDHQHVLNWALLHDDAGLARELAWLSRVLAARSFPLPWLARGVELTADELERRRPDLGAVVARLRAGAASVRTSTRSSDG